MKLICFTVVLLLWWSNLFSQYVPFKTENASWKVIIYKTYCYDGFCGYDEFKLEGDTLINSELYSNVYKYIWEPFEPDVKRYYTASIRNDIDNKRLIGFIGNTHIEEVIIYDFSLNINDTAYSQFTGDSAVVVSIDSVLVGSSYRKRYNLESLLSESGFYIYPYSIIEGIGSTNGLFESVSFTTVDTHVNELICYKENNLPVYPYDVDPDDCTSLVSSVAVFTGRHQISIYPNPVRSVCSITLEEPFEICKVYNSMGLIVRNFQVKGNSLQADFSDLLGGIYHIRCNTASGSYYAKFVIER